MKKARFILPMNFKLSFLFLLSLFFYTVTSQAQATDASAYEDGEWIKLRIHYGWFNASFATLEVNEKKIGDVPIFHVIGKGKSTGLLHAFYKVDDTYQSYIDQNTGLPIQFFRNIDEGGYKKDKVIWFDQNNRVAKVQDRKNNTTKEYTSNANVQDMISVFYHIRNVLNTKNLQKGEAVEVDMFFDEKNYKFKTVYLGEETIKTKFGKIKTLKFRPYVQSGRVFKEQESLTVWLSADDNKLPVKIKAKLAVGSLTADLEEFKGLKHPFMTAD